MFSVGDKVVCIKPRSDNDDRFDLEEGVVYTVIRICLLSTIYFIGLELGYDDHRFVLDIKALRKSKLERCLM